MGAPGTLIPTEVPSAHHQNFELDARSIATSPGSLKTFCTTSDQGALNRSLSPGFGERPKPSTSGAGSSVVSVHSNVRGRRSAGIILTEQLEHNVEDLYLPQEDNSREDQVSSTRNNSREDQVLEQNELVMRDRVDDQCHAIQCSENEVISTVEAGFGRDVDTYVNNVHIDPVLNGVAEILWEDLQIGERIGIGKNFSCIFPFSLLKFIKMEHCICRASLHSQSSTFDWK